MRLILFILSILLISTESFSKDCKLHRSDNVVVYGGCEKLDELNVIFYSCAGFTCRSKTNKTRVLDKSEEGCSTKNIKIIEEAVTEHGSLKDIPRCVGG